MLKPTQIPFAPNTAYFTWLGYRNAGYRGEPVSIAFGKDRPPEKDGVNWVNIGLIVTDSDGMVPFCRAPEEG